jgi:hypothetical protein
MLKILTKMRPFLSNLCMNISGKKNKYFTRLKNCIRSLFISLVSLQFKIGQIVFILDLSDQETLTEAEGSVQLTSSLR